MKQVICLIRFVFIENRIGILNSKLYRNRSGYFGPLATIAGRNTEGRTGPSNLTSSKGSFSPNGRAIQAYPPPFLMTFNIDYPERGKKVSYL